jgi:hypothetical protein
MNAGRLNRAWVVAVAAHRAARKGQLRRSPVRPRPQAINLRHMVQAHRI